MKKRLVVYFVLILGAAISSSARDTTELADLAVSISSSTSVATNGEWLTFYVTARNNGPTPIYAVDDCEIQCVAADGQYGDDDAGGGDPSDALVSGPGAIDKSDWIIRWFPGAIAPGQSAVMTVSIPLHIRDQDSLHTATASGGYSNGDVCDIDHDNNYTEMLLAYMPSADVEIRVEDNVGTNTFSITSERYQLTYTAYNSGPSVAHGVVVTSTLPPGCTYEVDAASWGTYALQGNILSWTVNGGGDDSFWPESSSWLYLWISPTNGGLKVTSTRLHHEAYDMDFNNNMSDHRMMVTGSSGGETNEDGVVVSVQLMGWDEVPVVERYGNIHYVLRLKSNMESNAVTGVVVTNLMDSRCLFDSASTPQGTVTQHNGVVVFDIGTLAAGSDLYLDLYVVPLESGTMTNHARLSLAEPGNEYGASAVIEESTVNAGPYVLTVTPVNSVNPTYGSRAFRAVVQTNGQAVAGVPLQARILRGPHMGGVSNAVTASPAPEVPPLAHFILEDDGGYPGRDYISVTGQVGKIPFSLDVQADWQLLGPQTYTCTNLGFITEAGENVFEIYVPNGFEIADITTGLHFEHTYPSDLEFRLYSPSDFGELEIETYLIEELAAFASDDLEVGRSNAYCVLDESAVTSISNAVSPFSGSFTSQNLEMTNYIGADSMGTWVLMIEDMHLDPDDFDYGELLGWTLTLEPADGDLDNDGMNDQWETDNDLDPNDPIDGDDDDDGDGVPNRSEFRTRTSPQSRSDRFGVSLPGLQDGQLVLRWNSESNQFYSVRWSASLFDGFETLESGIPATPPENEYPVTNRTLYRAFFRIDQEY